MNVAERYREYSGTRTDCHNCSMPIGFHRNADNTWTPVDLFTKIGISMIQVTDLSNIPKNCTLYYLNGAGTYSNYSAIPKHDCQKVIEAKIAIIEQRETQLAKITQTKEELAGLRDALQKAQAKSKPNPELIRILNNQIRKRLWVEM